MRSDWMQIGRFPDGVQGEVFLDAAKQNSALDALAADAAILISLLLQHGATLRQCEESDKSDRLAAPSRRARNVILVSCVIVAPAVTQHCGTAAPLHWPPACTIQSGDWARFVWVPSVRASSEAVARAKPVRMVQPQWAAKRCADAAHRAGVRGQ